MAKNSNGRGPTRTWSTVAALGIIGTGLALLVADSFGLATPPYQYLAPLMGGACAWIFSIKLREFLGRD